MKSTYLKIYTPLNSLRDNQFRISHPDMKPHQRFADDLQAFVMEPLVVWGSTRSNVGHHLILAFQDLIGLRCGFNRR